MEGKVSRQYSIIYNVMVLLRHNVHTILFYAMPWQARRCMNLQLIAVKNA